MIADHPELVAEARRKSYELTNLARPCGDSFVAEALQPLVLVYGLGAQAASPAFWSIYVKALSDLPRSALEQAVQDYASRPDAEFFPKPGPLREMALKAGEKLMRMASRAREAANAEPKRQIPITPLADVIGTDAPQPKAWPREHSRAERAAVKRMWEDFAAQHATRPEAAKPDFKPTPVATNEAGVSLEMLKLRQEQAGRGL